MGGHYIFCVNDQNPNQLNGSSPVQDQTGENQIQNIPPSVGVQSIKNPQIGEFGGMMDVPPPPVFSQSVFVPQSTVITQPEVVPQQEIPMNNPAPLLQEEPKTLSRQVNLAAPIVNPSQQPVGNNPYELQPKQVESTPLTNTQPSQELPQGDSSPPKPKGRLPFKFLLIGLGAAVFLGILGAALYKFVLPKPKLAENITLTYWGLSEDQTTMQSLINEFENTNKNVKINYIVQSKEDYRERLTSSLAKGGGPDVFRFHNSWVPMISSYLSSIPPEIMDSNQFQSAFYPVASKDLRRGSDLVGIPLMFDGLGLYINEEIFKNANVYPPSTWDELRTLANQLTVRDDSGRILQAGVALGRTDNVDHWEDVLALMMVQGDADLSNPIGELAEKPLKYYTVFTTQDHVWDETLPNSTQAFATGKLAMYFAPSWRAFEIKQQNPNLAFKVVPVPQLPKSNPTQQDVTWSSYWAEGVWVNSKGSNQAWQLLKFLSEKESQQKIFSQAQAAKLPSFVYSRVDMANLLESDPLLGAYVKQAPSARSWYLTSNTYGGPTGINSRISKFYGDAVNSLVKDNKEPAEVLPGVASGVKQILSNYGVSK